MKMGMAQELLAVEWLPDLKDRLSRLAPEIEWVHNQPKEVTQPLLMDGDACYPYKKMVRTSVSLLPFVDVLLLPRIVSLDGFLMCPNFRALPDIVRMNQERNQLSPGVRILSPEMNVADTRDLATMATRIARDLFGNHRREDSMEAQEPSPDRMEPHARDISTSIALIGHPYMLTDPRLNNGVPEILRQCGWNTVTVRDIGFNKLTELAAAHDFFAKTLYWRSGREVLGAFLYFTQVQRPAGIIHLVPFNCGVDALMRIELMGLYKQIENAQPYMVIVCDEHTQRDHVVTRVEAFLDMVHGIEIN